MKLPLTTVFACALIASQLPVSGQQASPTNSVNPYQKNFHITFDQLESDFNQLSKSKFIPADFERFLMECMHAPDGRGDNNLDSRNKKLEFLLKFYALCGSLRDPAFDPLDRKNFISMQPPVPPDSTIIPGMDPSSVKDPQQRAAYEALIEKNNADNARKYLQLTLFNTQKKILEYAKFYIGGHYHPEEQAALKQIISTQLTSCPEVAQILLSIKLEALY
jgi:hypothetical protein